VSQLGACALAIGVGILLGLDLWQLMAGGDLPRVEVSWTALLALLAAVPVAFAGIVSIPPDGSPGVHRPTAHVRMR
jgi:hypothetical protein